MSKEIGMTTKKTDDLSEWYTQVVTKAELADYSPVKGFIVLRPYGYSIWDSIKEYLDGRLKDSGHSNAYFPLLIPESFLKKEAAHFTGFTPEVFWVTQAGENQLSERLAIRPTSETIINDAYSKWVRSWRDLPLLINVWNSVLRAEITATRPFLRTTEFLWQEGHTVHATKEDADREVLMILGFYRDLIERQLAVPVLSGYKSEREKFVGALYTTTLEAMMPDGKAIQMGTSHNLGQNFSKPFEIKYLGKDEQSHYAWTTSWGVSWRLLSAMIMLHGDDRGLIVPPNIAPIQVVIVPIYFKDRNKEGINEKVRKVTETLKTAGLRTRLDDREQYTPGWKFNEWELKGVPVRVEVGPRDVEGKQVTLVRRDNFQKLNVSDETLIEQVRICLESIQSALFEKATVALKASIRQAENYEQLKQIIETSGGFVRACWCGNSECEDVIKAEIGATIRTLPLQDEATFAVCVKCGKPSKSVGYFARSY
ncbi:MAG TPA: proline--tRNA ligase [Methylomirabilota bacterium]|nr:proline--tRNA ligase [Methylomirabilota bacterium]